MVRTATYGLPEATTTMLESIVSMAKEMNDSQQAQLLEAGKAILLVGDLREMASTNKQPA